MKTLISMFALLLLAGCGPSRYFQEDQVDEKGLTQANTFYVQPVLWDFTPPDEWKLSIDERRVLFDACSRGYTDELKSSPDHALVFEPREGACVIVARVTSATHGAYSLVNYMPATLDVEVTILDATGQVLFRGTGKARTPSDAGEDGQTDLGRMKQAHMALAREILDLLNHYTQKRGTA
jgi:hypothetical protein